MLRIVVFILAIPAFSSTAKAGFFGDVAAGIVANSLTNSDTSPNPSPTPSHESAPEDKVTERMKQVNNFLFGMHRSGEYVSNYQFYVDWLDQQMIASGYDNLQYLDTIAWVYEDNGNHERAVEIYENRLLPWAQIYPEFGQWNEEYEKLKRAPAERAERKRMAIQRAEREQRLARMQKKFALIQESLLEGSEERIEEINKFGQQEYGTVFLEAQDLVNKAVENGKKTLRFDRKKFGDLGILPGEILLMTELKQLYINGIPISDVSTLSGLHSLSILDLTGTQVTDLSPIELLPNLQMLKIERTSIGDIGLLSEREAAGLLRVLR